MRLYTHYELKTSVFLILDCIYELFGQTTTGAKSLSIFGRVDGGITPATPHRGIA